MRLIACSTSAMLDGIWPVACCIRVPIIACSFMYQLRFSRTKDQGRMTNASSAVLRHSSFVIGLLLSGRQELYLCQSLLQETEHHGLIAIQIVFPIPQILGALLERLDQ